MSGGSTTSAKAARRSSAKTGPARAARPENHGDLWQAVTEIKVDLGEVKGQVKVMLAIAGATFLGVFGLMLAAIFP